VFELADLGLDAPLPETTDVTRLDDRKEVSIARFHGDHCNTVRP
jgi:hypothetical protein